MLTGPRRSNQEFRLGYFTHLGEVSQFSITREQKNKSTTHLKRFWVIPHGSWEVWLVGTAETEKTAKGSSYQGTKIEGWGNLLARNRNTFVTRLKYWYEINLLRKYIHYDWTIQWGADIWLNKAQLNILIGFWMSCNNRYFATDKLLLKNI